MVDAVVHALPEVFRAQLDLGRGQVVLKRAPQLEPQAAGDAFQRALDADQAVSGGAQGGRALAELRRRDAHQVALEALGQELAGALAQVVAERARVGAEHAEHQVGAAHLLAALARLGQDARDERQVTQHAEQRQERERDQTVRLGAGHAANELEHLRRLDAVELGPELERVERVEERAAIDLAVNLGEGGVEQPERHALGAQQPFDDLGAGGQAVAERDQALFGGGLVGALAEQAGARVVLGQHRLQVAVKDEGSIGTAEQLARERDGARQAVVKSGHVGAKVERDDGGAARRPRVIARIGEAGRGFEQHLELEQGFVAPFELAAPTATLRAARAARGAARASR